MQAKQMMAVFGALAFLGTFAVLAATVAAVIVAKITGEERLSRWTSGISSWVFGGWGLARKLVLVGLVLVTGYGIVLVTSSAASHEWTLARGEEKYFCETDCHLAYSVVSVEQTKKVGDGANQETASGTFYVVNVRTRFDEHTISAHRGNGPLTPSPREVALVDGQGRKYAVAGAAQTALEASLGSYWTPLTQPLRPGESFVTPLVFDVPAGTQGLKLLISSPTEPSWIGRLLIGDEDSVLHKKVYLRLAS
ncbi:MAG TPA: DUF4352 domain-containing protein [Candidatus Acidoferrum sp.]|nr:DUF4352 domain-containing protein [Candidatus Acidoferrum sp.]